MIEAKHSRWADLIFKIYLNHLLKKHFHAIRLFDGIPEIDPSLPVILTPNHSTWWDGFFIYFLNKKFFHRQGFLMMLEEQLQKYQFFKRIGAYSVDPANPKKLIDSLKYTIKILEENKFSPPLVCIFPQGELLPWGKRPLTLKRGIDWLLKKYHHKINLLPLAIRSEFGGEQRPEVFFLFGEDKIVDSHSFPGMSWLENILDSLLNKLENNIANQQKSKVIFSGKISVNIKMDHIFGKK